jgi:hypothetical protein
MSAFWLKTLACLIMLTDHTGAVFAMFTPDWLRWIGRIAFPVYVYFIAEGCARTRDINRYLLRLGVFALLSEIPFDASIGRAFFGRLNIDFLSFTNVFYTLFLGVLAVSVYQGVSALRRPVLALLPYTLLLPLFFRHAQRIVLLLAALYAAMAYILSRLLPARDEPGSPPAGSPFTRLAALTVIIPLIWLAELLGTDYGGFGVVFILALYFAGAKKMKLVFLFIFVCLEYGSANIFRDGNSTARALLGTALLAVPLTALYNGRRGPNLKWVFYAFYPVHLALLAALAFFIYPR